MHAKQSLLLALFASSANAFSTSPFVYRRYQNAVASRLLMSDLADDSPSDTSNEDTIDIQSEAIEPTVSESIVSSIFDELPEGLVTSVSKDTRAKINEAVLKLEAMNPTEEPTMSPLLNGIWSLRYVGGYDDDWALKSPTRQLALFAYSGGYSPGMFALSLASSLPTGLIDVGELEIGKLRVDYGVFCIYHYKLK
jgi:hypothetical protein